MKIEKIIAKMIARECSTIFNKCRRYFDAARRYEILLTRAFASRVTEMQFPANSEEIREVSETRSSYRTFFRDDRVFSFPVRNNIEIQSIVPADKSKPRRRSLSIIGLYPRSHFPLICDTEIKRARLVHETLG